SVPSSLSSSLFSCSFSSSHGRPALLRWSHPTYIESSTSKNGSAYRPPSRWPPPVAFSPAPFHVSSFEFEIVSKETCGGVACFIISNHPSLSTKGFPEIL
ncbi:unnamed protein product, partial [Musa hybrid cultivar]